MFFTAITLLWQHLVFFACCFGVGLFLRFLIPKEFSVLNKVLFSLISGLFLVVLIAENLVYLGLPVRISAWLLMGAALVQVWLCRRKLVAWIRVCRSNGDMLTLAVVSLLTIAFHGIVPIRQGLESYYGKGYTDQLNYVQLAEFLKEESYSTSEQDIGLRPWLVRSIGFRYTAEEVGMSSGAGLEMVGLKKQRIGQSIITAEISVWSGTDAQGGYAATVIFSLTVLAICLYVFLRETGIDRFMAASGALLAALLPAVTRLSLNGFLSQASILFVFPFFACLLRHHDLSARGFTLFFSLALAYLIAAYSEVAPIGFFALFLGVMFVRHDEFRAKRLILMSAILLIALMNPFYLGNLIEFLGQQYYMAANTTYLESLAPNLLTLRGRSELIFGVISSAPLALFLDYCAILLGLLIVAGAIFLSRRDKLVAGAILLPVILAILYLSTRTPPSYYPIAKIILSILPLLIGLVFVALSRAPESLQNHRIGLIKKLFCASLVAAAAAGSFGYYSEVLNNDGVLKYVREPHFLEVCRKLEETKNTRVLVFESDPWLLRWLCYRARHNEVYFDVRFIGDSAAPPLALFSRVPDFKNVDFIAARDRIVDLRAPSVSCLTLIDDTPTADRTGHIRYWLGPPARLRFLALRPILANLKMRLAPAAETTALPVDYFLADDQGHVSQGELRGKKNTDIGRIEVPRGLSILQLSVQAKDSDPNMGPFPILAELDGIEISDIK